MAARLARICGQVLWQSPDTRRILLQEARMEAAHKLGAISGRSWKTEFEGRDHVEFPKGSTGHCWITTAEHVRRLRYYSLRRRHHLLRNPRGREKQNHVDVNDLIFRKITLRPTFAEPAINFSRSLHCLREGLVTRA